MKIQNYKNNSEKILSEWNPYDELRQSSWAKPYIPYQKNEKVVFDYTNKWCFTSGSVYHWINNGCYAKSYPDKTNIDVYFLSGGRKYCAGVVHKEKDIFIDGLYYYYIKDLIIKNKIKDCSEHAWITGERQYKFSFTIDSYPMDTPAIIVESNREDNKKYIGAMKIDDFEVVINHADYLKIKQLSTKQIEEVRKKLSKIFAKSKNILKYDYMS